MRLQQYLLTESINDKGIMKAVILGGVPLSGKTTVIQTIISNGSFPVSVPDADFWTEKHKGVWSKDNKRLANSTYLMTINGLRPLYLDTTSGNIANFKSRVRDLRDMGYDVKMVFVDLDLETSLKRAKERNSKIKRQVSPEFIEDTFNKIYGKGKYKSIESTPLYKQYTNILKDKPIIVNGSMLDWNDTNKKVYNKVTKYLSSPIKNPKGKKLVDYMRKNGYKYYMQVPEEWLVGNKYPLLRDISYYRIQKW